MKKVVKQNIENLIETGVNTSRGRAKTHKIEWTEKTWNPSAGCTKISSGCKNCYAERLAKRLQAMGQRHYLNGFNLELHHDSLEIPFNWKQPAVVFVNSMSDLFHEKVPLTFISKVFDVMSQSPQHIFQVLTKRSERLAKISGKLSWSPNIWMGVSVENGDYIYRIEDLKKTKAKIKFVSMEPLLGQMPKINLSGIDWVIVGGESGNDNGHYQYRPCQLAWIEKIVNDCKQNNIPVFVKQLGTYLANKFEFKDRHGGNINEFPANLQVREFPKHL